ETAMVRAVGRELGPVLTQVAKRALVWWIDMPHDLRRGDRLDVLFEEVPGEEPVIHALRFESGKTGQVHRVYRFRRDADPYPRYYEPSGRELEERLVHSPMDRY